MPQSAKIKKKKKRKQSADKLTKKPSSDEVPTTYMITFCLDSVMHETITEKKTTLSCY
jgi:hypothetical protein